MLHACSRDTDWPKWLHSWATRRAPGWSPSLWDGRARPAGELAHLAGVTPATASAHLSKLLAGGVLRVETRGRHRFFRLADERVAQAIEALAAILPPGRAPEAGAMPPLHLARLCYDHLAGRLGVSVSDALLERGLLLHEEGAYSLPAKGPALLRAVRSGRGRTRTRAAAAAALVPRLDRAP
jgi:DNA-binding transcriptional ArsR family regulator